MKLLICLIIFTVQSYGQVVKYGDEKYLDFTLKYATDTTTVDGIDWKRENLVSEFTLKGKFRLKYSIKLLNDSEALLSQYDNNEWVVQDTIEISGWTLSYIENNKIISKFRITDFDNDGNEDITCWIFTNMHNDISTNVFLNNPEQQRLIKLYDFAENTDVWADPKYDDKRKIIKCNQYSGLFGVQSESTYKLINYSAIPLSKTVTDLTSYEFMIKQKFKGVKGKWHFLKENKRRIRSYYTD